MNLKKYYTKENNHINRYKNTNEFIRAEELIPDYDENEFIEGNLLVLNNYSNPNFIFDNSNIKKGLEGIYPFNLILSMNSRQDKKILYMIYERELSFIEMCSKLKCSSNQAIKYSKRAHENFYSNLKAFGRLQHVLMKKWNGEE